MKKLALAILLCGIPAIEASTISKADIIATVQHQRRLVHEAQADAAIAKADLVAVQFAIDTQTAKLHQTENQLSVVTKERDSALHHLHMLLLISSSLAGGCAFLLALRFASILPPTLIAYEFLFSSGIGIVVGGLTWSILGHL